MSYFPYTRFDFNSTQNYYYPLTFDYVDNNTVIVIISDASGQSKTLEYGTDYTLEGAQINILNPGTLETKYSLTITKIFAIRYLGEFEAPEFNYGTYLDVKKVQRALKTISLHLSELRMIYGNTFVLPYEEWKEGESSDLTVPTKEDRVNKILAFDENGKLAPILSTDIEQKLSEALAAEERTLTYRDDASTYAQTTIDKASEASTSADNAKTSETNAKASEDAVTKMQNTFTDTYNTSMTNIGNAQSSALEILATTKDGAVGEVEQKWSDALKAIAEKLSEALGSISTDEGNALSAIKTNKESAVEEINTTRDSATGSVDVHKDLAVQAVADEKDAALNEIGKHEENVTNLADQVTRDAKTASDSATTATNMAGDATDRRDECTQLKADCEDIKTAISQQLDAATAISVIDGAINITYTV